ncbi:MAG: hypothetical protein A3H28_12905 [Acidobacteria bacterium RIFCSPLOWO2_02_FULL_61_28]|nr:MAG: hypothetical protein A3H28_12905 [Acidobacteria bacterium RIFCSPLOWO2_02_FULL_61_28]
MYPAIVLAVIAVLLMGLAVSGVIWYWGPRFWNRFLLCPEKNLPARVIFGRKEGSFGSLEASDVKECSLFAGGPVTCDKHCVS